MNLLPFTPPGLIRLIVSQQPDDKPNQLASGQHYRSLVPVLRYFLILLSVVICILWGMHPDSVGSLTKVISQVSVSTTRERGLLRLELSRLMLAPGEACIFSNLCLIVVESLQIPYLCDDSG